MTTQLRLCVLVIAASLSSQMAHAQLSTTPSTGDYASDVGILMGVIRTQGFTRDLCKEQFSYTQQAVDEAYNIWRERYKPFLQEVALRWNLLVIQIAKETNTSLADVTEAATGEMEQLRASIKTTYLKAGPDKFQALCDKYPTDILGEAGDIEKRYPEHVETMRKVKLN